MPHRLAVVEAAGTEGFGSLTHFRASFELRCGILPLWRKLELQYRVHEVRLFCRAEIASPLRRRAPRVYVNEWSSDPALLLDGRIVADPLLPQRIPLDGPDDIVFIGNGEPIGARLSAAALDALAGVPLPRLFEEAAERWPHEAVDDVHLGRWPWELVRQNSAALANDFELLVSKTSGALQGGTIDLGAWLQRPESIHIGRGARVHAGAVLDAENGPIYVAERATIMPGAVAIGPAAVGEGSALKIHAKIYPGTTIGPVCKIGGEVEDTIVHGWSNKQHDGFLGHAYLGEWVNLGAGTNNSDLKNNYGNVRVKIGGRDVDTGLQFVGLVMGDHSKSGIGTSFNTGTVVGSCCNIFGAGLPPKVIPSFSWGGADGFVAYDIERCLAVARTVMARRDVKLQSDDEQLIRALHKATVEERTAAGISEATTALMGARPRKGS